MKIPKAPSHSSIWLALPSVFLITYAVLTFEVALTRIFSVMLSYHFVFAIVSAALLGLGVGAMLLKRWRGLRISSASRVGAILFPLLIVVSVLLIITLPQVTSRGFWIYLVLAVLPFAAAGFAVSGIFQQFADKSPLLYGADLLGAALGALTIVPLLDVFGGVNAVFFAASAAALGALLLGFSSAKFPALTLGAFLLVTASFAAITGSKIKFIVPVTNDQYKEMYSMLSNPEYKAEIVESRWSSFGRTDLVKSELFPNEMTLFVDGAAPSTMYNLNAILKSPEETAHLTMHFGEFFPFFFISDEEKRNALIIGPGGGRDVVVAILGGVKAITAVEVNPDVVKIVRDYQDYSGGIYSSNPNVQVVIDEGRNFVRKTDQRFDLIMLSIPVIRSSRSVEGYALTENYLFTVEAFDDYLSRLTAQGRIIIVVHNNAELYRIVSLAAAALGKRGSTEAEALNHIYTVGSDMKPAIVIKNQPLTAAEAMQVHDSMHRMGFDKGAFFIPYVKQAAARPIDRIGEGQELRMFDQFLVNVSEGKLSLEKLARSAAIDIGPVTDNRPFFYKFERGLPKPFGTFAFLIAAGLGLLAILQGNPDFMNSQFDLAMKANPQDRDVQSCLDELKRETTALEEAVQRTPEEAPLRSRLGKRYLLLLDYERAAEQYGAFAELKPANASGWNNLGVCHARLERFEEAIRAFSRAIELDPASSVAYVNLAGVHEKRSDLAAASQTLEKAAAACSGAERTEIFDKLARSYFMQKKYDLALETLEKAIKFVSNDSQRRGYFENRREFVRRAAKEARANDPVNR